MRFLQWMIGRMRNGFAVLGACATTLKDKTGIDSTVCATSATRNMIAGPMFISANGVPMILWSGSKKEKDVVTAILINQRLVKNALNAMSMTLS